MPRRILFSVLTMGFVVVRAHSQLNVPNAICSDVLNNTALQMRAILVFERQLIIIDKDWMLYIAEQSQLDNIEQQGIHMGSVKPRHIEQQWSAFESNQQFKKLKNQIIEIYSTPLHSSPWVVMIVNASNEFAINYNLKKNTIQQGPPLFSISNDSRVSVPITGEQFVTMEYSTNQAQLSLMTWIYGNTSISENRLEPPQVTATMPLLYNEATHQLLTQTLSTPAIANSSQFAPLLASAWPVKAGILLNGRFILFAGHRIYSFAQTVLNGRPVEVTITADLSQFFKCTIKQEGTSESARAYGLIIAISVIVALVIMTTVGVITYLTSRKARKRLKHSSRNVVGSSTSQQVRQPDSKQKQPT